MDPASFLAALYLVHLGAAAAPGPNTLLVTAMAASGQRGAALWAAAGTGAGALVWVAATLGGASALFVAFPRLAVALRWAGGAYLIYLGGRALWSVWRSRGGAAAPAAFAPAGAAGAFRRGLVTNLGNPKSLAYYLSLLAASAAPEAPLWLRIAGGAGMVAISLIWYMFLAWTFSRAPVRRVYRRAQPAIAGCTGLLMAAFGGALILAL